MSEASDLFFSWASYATNLLNDSQQPLSFSDWLVAESATLGLREIIDSLLLDQSDVRLSYQSVSSPPDLSSSEEPMLPLPHSELYGQVLFEIKPDEVQQHYFSGLPSDVLPTLQWAYKLAIYDSSGGYTYHYLPYVFYTNYSVPVLIFFEFQFLVETQTSPVPEDNYSFNSPFLNPDGSFFGHCGFINLTVISLKTDDCDCCGCCSEGGGMADCADLVNAVLAIKEQQEFLNTKYETILDQVTSIATSNAQIAELLNLRLVHRDFTTQAFRDLQAGIGLAADTISQRAGLIAHSIAGFQVPSSNVPDTPLTDLGLNQDTPPSGSGGGSGSGSGGGGGGGGGEN